MVTTPLDNLQYYHLRLGPGEDLFQSLRDFVDEQGLTRAFLLSTIGSLRRVVVNFPKALVDNPEEILRPGMSANIEVVLHRRASALTVPSDAVFVEGGQAFVYLVNEDSTVTFDTIQQGHAIHIDAQVVHRTRYPAISHCSQITDATFNTARLNILNNGLCSL